MTTKITLNNIADTALATLTGPKVTTIVYPGDDTATDTAGGATINLTGNGFQSGCSVLVASTASSVVTFISATQISFIAPALSAGTYVIYVINPDGGTAISIPGISYSGTPNWSTAAGTLGTAYETSAINTTLTAAGDDPITYALASGTLPPGSTLNSNGTLSGTAQATASATTYSFTISANDAQNQTTNRSFSLTINPDVVSWVTPADSTTYTVTKDSAISNVTLSATSAAGGSITYTADTLPTGLSITGANIAGTPTVSANTSTVLTATSTATRTATKTINWVVNVGNDPFFKYTTLLLQGASTTFVKDASINNFAVTIAGDTKPSNFNPYTPGYYSNLLGVGDYLQLPITSAFQFGTSNFTIECWVYLNSVVTVANRMIWYNYDTFGTDSIYFGGHASVNGQVTFWAQNISASAPLLTDPTVLTAGVWTHIAVVRNGNNFTLYRNGVSVNTATSSVSIVGPSWSKGGYIGTSGTASLNGYISNFRIVNGTAVYTGAFTPPTAPLTAITNTAILTCQSNRFIDNSTNNLVLTPFGTPSVNAFDPFLPNPIYSSYGSAYFDGTGDMLTVSNLTGPLTGNFTYECWAYPTTTSGSYKVLFGIDNYNSVSTPFRMYQNGSNFEFWYAGANITATGIVANTWYHVAITRASGVLRLFVNGVQAGSNVNSGLDYPTSNFRIGMDSAGTYAFVGYISNVRAVNNTALYTTNFTPPTEPLTAIANTSLLTLQNNQSVNNHTFLDSSTNNFVVTRAGNTTQGTFSPYGGNWSNYFDGSGDYLSVVDNAALQFGTGDFTVEAWIYVTTLAAARPIFEQRAGGASFVTFVFYVNTNGKLSFYVNPSPDIAFDLTVVTNSWNHVALVRQSGVMYCYLNGVKASNSAAWTGNNTTSINRIGSAYDGANINGYMSNFRIVKGTAVYTANFTPSTQPLTAIAGTSLLTCADNRFIDESPNNFAITRTGDGRVTNFSPFKAVVQTPRTYSAYFDGTGDFLTLSTAPVAATGTFTVECWVYVTGTAAAQSIYGQYLGGASPAAGRWNMLWNDVANKFSFSIAATSYTSASTYSTNTWYHIAWVRDESNNLSLYVNGVRDSTNAGVSTSLYTGNPIIGARSDGTTPYTGYISNFRVTNTVVYSGTTYTVPTSPLTAITGTTALTCQSATLIDNSTNRLAITANGDTKPTIVNPFGSTFANSTGYTVAEYGGSAYFDGTGDYLTIPASTNFQFSGDFTIEGWMYFINAASGSPQALFSVKSGATEFDIRWFTTRWQVSLNAGSGTDIGTTPAAVNNSWTHVACVRSGNSINLYINGVKTTTTLTNSSTLGQSAQPASIGASTSGNIFTGYISNIRIIKGQALYTSNFVPPLVPVTPVQNTVLLLNGTGSAIADATTKNVTETVGDARISTAVSKFGSSSMAFDGTGDYLFSPNSVNYAFGTGDFTAETWVYLNASKDQGIFDTRNSGPSATGIAFAISASNFPYVYVNSATLFTSSTALSLNTWTHVAFVKYNGTITLYINGTKPATGSATSATNLTDTACTIGSVIDFRDSSATYHLNGYMQDFRITRGVARYTSNFTAPTSEFKTF